MSPREGAATVGERRATLQCRAPHVRLRAPFQYWLTGRMGARLSKSELVSTEKIACAMMPLAPKALNPPNGTAVSGIVPASCTGRGSSTLLVAEST